MWRSGLAYDRGKISKPATLQTLNWSSGWAEKKTGRKDVSGLERVSAMPRGKGKQVAFESSRHWKRGNPDSAEVNDERSPGKIALRADKQEIQ